MKTHENRPKIAAEALPYAAQHLSAKGQMDYCRSKKRPKAAILAPISCYRVVRATGDLKPWSGCLPLSAILKRRRQIPAGERPQRQQIAKPADAKQHDQHIH